MLFLSTVYTGHETVIRKRKRPNSTQPYSRQIKQKFGQMSVLQLCLPSIAADYNDRMNGVDRADHLRSIIRPRHRQRRGPARALTWDFLLLTALANSFILQLQGRPSWTPERSQSQWLRALSNDIFKTHGKAGSSRERYISGDTVTPIEQHQPGPRGRAPCMACQGIRIGPRSRSSQRPRKQGPLQQLGANSINSRARARPQSGRQLVGLVQVRRFGGGCLIDR